MPTPRRLKLLVRHSLLKASPGFCFGSVQTVIDQDDVLAQGAQVLVILDDVLNLLEAAEKSYQLLLRQRSMAEGRLDPCTCRVDRAGEIPDGLISRKGELAESILARDWIPLA